MQAVKKYLHGNKLLQGYLIVLGVCAMFLVSYPPAIPVSWGTVYNIHTDKEAYFIGETIHVMVYRENKLPVPLRVPIYHVQEITGYYLGDEENKTTNSAHITWGSRTGIMIPAYSKGDGVTSQFPATKTGVFIVEFRLEGLSGAWVKRIQVSVEQ